MLLERSSIEPRSILPGSVEERLAGWLSGVTGSLLIAGAAAGWVSLLTWSVHDPSLTHATSGATRNWLGPFGAIVSDLLLQTIGLAAIVALLAPAMMGLELLRRGRCHRPKFRIGVLMLACALLAGGLSALPTPAFWALNHGLGGIVGDGVYQLVAGLLAMINPARAGLVAGLLMAATGTCLLSVGLGISQQQWALVWSEIPDGAAWGRDAWRRISLRRATAASAVSVSAPSGTEHPNNAFGGAERLPLVDAGPGLPMPAYGAPPPSVRSLGPGPQSGYYNSRVPHVHPARPAQPAPMPAPMYGAPPEPAFQTAPSPYPPHPGQVAPMTPVPMRPPMPAHDAEEAAGIAIARRFAPMPPPQGPHRAAGAKPPVATERRALQLPSVGFLKSPPAQKGQGEHSQTVQRGNARLLEGVLADFGVKGEVKSVHPGPVVTLYELEPSRGTKASRVIGLADDIARSMSALSARVASVQGRNAIGIEIANARRETVYLRELLESEAWQKAEGRLPIVLGKNIVGVPVIADLAGMPHLLVAGTTGSGKSVGVNAMILSLLYRLGPESCRFLMIDPKMLELSVYNGIPHLLAPVVTDPHQAAPALGWAVTEMEERYKRMARLGVRNIESYNNRVREALSAGKRPGRQVQTGYDEASGRPIYVDDQHDLEPMPYIVIVVDEFADLMAVAGKEIELLVQRLAQMARAAGIHLIMATQRPSVDVVTGTIKANFPRRIAFKVASKIDSRTILNEQGAEQLLGAGDMLFSTGGGQSLRVHAPFCAEDEVEKVVRSLQKQAKPAFVEALVDATTPGASAPQPGSETGPPPGNEADLYDRAVAIVHRDQKASTSYLQRRLAIGYNRAASLIERMEQDGIVSPADNVGRRRILIGEGAGSSLEG